MLYELMNTHKTTDEYTRVRAVAKLDKMDDAAFVERAIRVMNTKGPSRGRIILPSK